MVSAPPRASAQTPDPSGSSPALPPPVPSAAPSALLPPAATPASMPPAPEPPPSDRSSVGPTVALVGFSITALGVIVGTISGGVAMSKTSSLRDACGGTVCPKSKQDDIDSARNAAGLSTVSFVLAAIGAVVGVNGLILWNADRPASSTSARVQWRPTVGLGSAGVQGSF
jgi:hypothetical protein